MAETPVLESQKSNGIALWDRIGIGASTLCLIHCLVLPVVLGALPLLNRALVQNERIHQALAAFIVVTCGFALIPGLRCHGRPGPLGLGAIGLLLLLSAAFLAAPLHAEAWETPLTVAGGLFLVSAHLLNLRLTRRHHCCHGHRPRGWPRLSGSAEPSSTDRHSG